MKWYSVKKYTPSYEGEYLIRYIDDDGFIGLSNKRWNVKCWVDFDESDHLFKGNITHFCIPDPVEIEE